MVLRPRPVRPAAVLTGKGYRVFPVETIDWVESAGNRVQIQLGATAFPARATLRETIARLGPEFRQIHRRYAVNVTRIAAIHPNGDGGWVVRMNSGAELPIGRTYRASLFAALTTL